MRPQDVGEGTQDVGLEPSDELVATIAEAVSSYLDDLNDPGDVDSDDLAENIARELVRRGGAPRG